jgi:L-seryl-tRNA(Ser) seleniumtransferase
VERGHFFLDPCNLHPGEAEIVAERLRSILTAKDRPADAMKPVRKESSGALRWPD